MALIEIGEIQHKGLYEYDCEKCLHIKVMKGFISLTNV